MQNVILAVHILACLAITIIVLLQRSEGGALGIGGGSGSMLSGRGAAGALVRTTMIFAGIFFITSLVLTTLASRDPERSAVERAAESEGGASGPIDILDPDANILGDDLTGDTAAEPDPLADPEDTSAASAPGADTGDEPSGTTAPGESDPFADPPN
ncbi:MAG: preprotein translocase subunit SecG [Pseudomonadota bacterium]